jgi:MauM/NapG family ferredoxin protein
VETRRHWLRRLLAPMLPLHPLRPPGARAEAELVALCIRCNRCIEVCPYGALKPAGWVHGPDAGTPLLEPADVPCYLCMDCPPVCPTDALEPITEKSEVRMGRAVVDEEACWAFQGVLCRTCVDECPMQEAADTRTGEPAIYQNALLRPVVTGACVGCGLCERFCPGKDAAGRPVIRVIPADRLDGAAEATA